MGDQTKNANFLFSGRVRFRRVKSPLLDGPLSLERLLTAWAWNAMEGSPFKIPKTAQNQFISIIFSIFPRIKFCGPHYHTHTHLLPLSLSPSPSPLPPLPLPCVLLNEGFAQRWRMIRSYRIWQHPLEIILCTTPNMLAPRVGNTGTGLSGSHSYSFTRSYKYTPVLESISHRKSPMTQRNKTMLREMTSSNSNAL